MFKKLLTLAAVAALGFSAQADVVVDYEINYGETGWHFYVMGYEPQVVDGILVSENPMSVDEKTGEEKPEWYQYFMADGIKTDPGRDYKVTVLARASEEVTIGFNMGWGWGDGESIGNKITLTEEWDEIEVIFEKIGGTSCNVVAQPGTSLAKIEWKWLKVSHSEAEDKAEWIDIIDPEVCCFYSKEYEGRAADGSEIAKPHEGKKEMVDGEEVWVSHAKKVDPSVNGLHFSEGEELWGQTYHEGDPRPDCQWQNQVWIQAPRAMQEGEQFRIEFTAKASKNFKAGTGAHKLKPGDYLSGLGNGVNLTTDWVTYSVTGTANKDQGGQLYSLSLDLGTDGAYVDDIDFYVKDIKWMMPKLDEGFFVAGDFNKKDWSNPVELKWDSATSVYAGIVGNSEAPASQIKISIRSGNEAGFLNNAISIDEDVVAGKWLSGTYNGKKFIDLPKEGVWKIEIDADLDDLEEAPMIRLTEVSSGISAIAIDKAADNAIYNVYGQRVNENYKGVVIKNGKKYLNK